MNSLFKENMQNYISVDHVIAGIPEMYFYRYVSGATISVMKYWVQDPKRLPVDELILYIYKIVYNGPYVFYQNIAIICINMIEHKS